MFDPFDIPLLGRLRRQAVKLGLSSKQGFPVLCLSYVMYKKFKTMYVQVTQSSSFPKGASTDG